MIIDESFWFKFYDKPGYYYFIGDADGEQGVPPMLIAGDDEIFQETYDQGYSDGSYKRQFLIATSM